jgi:hypothetical protein
LESNFARVSTPEREKFYHNDAAHHAGVHKNKSTFSGILSPDTFPDQADPVYASTSSQSSISLHTHSPKVGRQTRGRKEEKASTSSNPSGARTANSDFANNEESNSRFSFLSEQEMWRPINDMRLDQLERATLEDANNKLKLTDAVGVVVRLGFSSLLEYDADKQ